MKTKSRDVTKTYYNVKKEVSEAHKLTRCRIP